MKIITYSFNGKNIRNVFITLILLFNVYFSFSQSPPNLDLRNCGFDCTSNNYTLTDVYLSLSDVNGIPLTNTTCTPGVSQTVYVWLNYSSNSGSDVSYARLNADLIIDGVPTFINVYLGNVESGSHSRLLYQFNWICGQELILGNPIIVWKTSGAANANPGPNYTCDSFSNSQCDFSGSVLISRPLAVQFEYTACTVGADTTVKFTSTTNGGIAPYTYAWDFNNDGGIPDETIANPTFTYTTTNNTAKLTVTDSQNLTNTYILPIVAPNEIMLSETHTSIGCSGGTTDLTLNVTGGTPDYTYSWNTGATTKDLSNISPGSYTVTVTDINGCEKTQTFMISQPATLDATTSQTDVSCGNGSDGTATVTVNGGTSPYTYSWSPSGGTNATATGLVAGDYTVTITDDNGCNLTKTFTIIDGDSIKPIINPLPDPTTIECPSEPVFAEATATDNNVTISSLTFTDAITQGNCSGAYTKTRTWIAIDACGNESLPVSQTITIEDTTDPTWTNAANSLDVTLQCDDLQGLSNAQALFPTAADNCDADLLNISKTEGVFVASESCSNAGTYTNTWTITDDCDNTSETFTQTITIEDTTDPTWTNAANSLDITLQCDDLQGLSNAQTLFPTAADNCDVDLLNISKTEGVFVASESCSNAGTYTNTWTITDDCDNTSETFTQTITIEDTTDPTWTNAANSLDATLQCDDLQGLSNAQSLFPTAVDNCDVDLLNISKTEGVFVASESCSNAGTYTNTWTITDDCDNTSETFTQTITIEDTTDPTWTNAANSLDITLQCDDLQGLSNAQTLFPTAADNCDVDLLNISKTEGVFVASESCSNAGTYTNTWTITDDCDNTSETFTQTITIEDTTDPTWTNAANSLDVTLQCDDLQGLSNAQSLFPTAVDNCDVDLLNISKTEGVFVASESCSNAGTYTNTWTITDDCDNTSETFTQTITIEDTTDPTWTNAANSLDVTLQCDDLQGLSNAQSLFPTAVDNCDVDLLNISKTEGVFVASESCSNAGTYTNTWTITDDCDNTSETFTQTITIEDTTDPTWTNAANSLDVTLQCDDLQGLSNAQALFPTAADNCDADLLNISKTEGVFVASESCSNAGTYTNTWTITDDCDNTSETFTQTITIEDTTDPTWTNAANSLDITLQCDDLQGLSNAQALFPTAADNCDIDLLNISKTEGVFVASESCSNAGTYTNTWTITDDCDNTSETFTQTITIEDTTDPTWTNAANSLDVTLQCDDLQGLSNAQALFPTAADNCDADLLNISKTEGVFVASESCSNAGTYTNTWTITDDCDNVSETFTQTITIEDTTDPTWTNELPGDITVSCDNVPEVANMEASDNCNGNLPIVFSETKSNTLENCTTNYTLTRKWSTSDCSDNVISYTQIITVKDTTPPTGNAPSDVTGLESITEIPVANPGVITNLADNCSENIDITFNDTNNEGSGCEGNPYILTRTYTLTDCAGNKTELTQTFTVENKVSVTGIVSNVTCFRESDGSIAVTNGSNSTVVITNQNNEVVGNTNLPAGTYTLTATSPVNNDRTCETSTTVTITEPSYRVKISGQIMNIDTNTPISNISLTLIPQGRTGTILFCVTDENGYYSLTDMPTGAYLLQVQDANLNNAYGLYPINSSLFFTTLEECAYQVHDFQYGKSRIFPVLGDYVWYDVNGNGLQDEWYDANNDGVVTENFPDENGLIDYNLWEWVDFNGDNSYTGTINIGELNAGGFGNSASPNIFIDGPNGYHKEVIIGIQGYWRDRPGTGDIYGDYTSRLVMDANLEAVSAALAATGLVKPLPGVNNTNKKITSKVNNTQARVVCGVTGGDDGFTVTVTPENLIFLGIDFGISCKTLATILATDDSAGPFVGASTTTSNILNVLTNDTIDGVATTSSSVIVTTVTPNAFLQLNTDGTLDLLPNAPAGTYTLTYQICDKKDSGNCDTATVTIVVTASQIVANNDTYTNIGCNTFGLVGNALSNDTLNGAPAKIESVNFTLVASNSENTNSNITIDTSGNVTVTSLTPPGTYIYNYQICEKLNPNNCSSGTIRITVIPNGVTNIESEACNNDSSPINLLTLLPANTPTTGTWIDSNNSNSIQGNIFNPLGLALGQYIFEYQIIDANCPRSILLNVEVNDDCRVLPCEKIIVHNAFSPNGDDKNDTFRIDYIDDIACYPENTVEIYNRWGVLIFETKNYNNDNNYFDGNSKGRTTIKKSDGLPTGTYYYIINYKSLDSNNISKTNKEEGYLYIAK